MAYFQCTECKGVIEAAFPSMKCKACGKINTYVAVESSAKAESTQSSTAVKTEQTTGATAPTTAPPRVQVEQTPERSAGPPNAPVEAEPVTTSPTSNLPPDQPISEPANPVKKPAEIPSISDAMSSNEEGDQSGAPEVSQPADSIDDQSSLIFRFRVDVPADTESKPLRAAPVLDAENRLFVAIEHCLVMFNPPNEKPEWRYITGGPILGMPVIGSDGNVRVHSTDGHLHIVTPDGKRCHPPIKVGMPLASATPVVDDQNRTWICLSTGGITMIEDDGTKPKHPPVRTRRRFDSQGVISQGVLYIGCEDHYVHAIDIVNNVGESLWEDDSSAGKTVGAINAPLAITNDREVLAVSHDGLMYAFDREGKQSWTFKLPGNVLGGPVLYDDDYVLLGVSQTPRDHDPSGMIICIDRGTRKPAWKFSTSAPVESRPLLAESRIIFGDNAGHLYVLSDMGSVVMQNAFKIAIRSQPASIAPGLVAFGLEDGSLAVINCSSNNVEV